MYYENKFIGMVNNYKPLFTNIFHEYKNKCSGNDTSFLDWQKQREQVESKIAKELNYVTQPYFRKKLQVWIQYWKDHVLVLEPGCNFDKFCYYIDKLSKEKYSNEIIKYNKNYCDRVINQLAKEYIRILNFIEKNAEIMSKVNNKEYTDAQEKILNLWKEMQKNSLDQIINDEYVAIINEINNKVN